MEEIVNLFANLVSNLGVPVTCMAVLFKMLIDERKQRADDCKEWLTAINNNTVAMNKLIEVVAHENSK